jgi:hypothetical protein
MVNMRDMGEALGPSVHPEARYGASAEEIWRLAAPLQEAENKAKAAA